MKKVIVFPKQPVQFLDVDSYRGDNLLYLHLSVTQANFMSQYL